MENLKEKEKLFLLNLIVRMKVRLLKVKLMDKENLLMILINIHFKEYGNFQSLKMVNLSLVKMEQL